MTDPDFQKRLFERAGLANLSIANDLARSIELYFGLLSKWNQKINLSGLDLDTSNPVAIDRLLIEPILAAKQITTPRAMIDIGSGGGSPAIPMALAFGSLELLMVESKSRKAVFLQEAIRQLEMKDAHVAISRYETLLSAQTLLEHFDLLTVRAVRISRGVLSEIQSFVRPGGCVMLFRSDTSEEPAPPPSLRLTRSHVLVESLRSRIDVFERLG